MLCIWLGLEATRCLCTDMTPGPNRGDDTIPERDSAQNLCSLEAEDGQYERRCFPNPNSAHRRVLNSSGAAGPCGMTSHDTGFPRRRRRPV